MAATPDRSRRESLRRRARELRRLGFERVAGVDEAGVGPLAGPLVAAAVVLPARARLPEVDDSKRMTAERRARCVDAVRARAVCSAVAEVSASEVDELGPYRASLTAMARAIRALDPPADYLLIDARALPDVKIPQESVVGGDGRHLAIAAASVLAKVERDRRMLEIDAAHPGYGFARHMGYGTADHMEALRRLGPCPEHRRRCAPVRAAEGRQGSLFDDPGAPSSRSGVKGRSGRSISPASPGSAPDPAGTDA